VEDDRKRTVTKFRKGALTLAAVAGAAVLIGAPPAWADDESDAKRACKQIAENRDWDDTKAKVTKENDNRIVVTMTGERNNNDKERRCVYNSNSKEARFVGP
jgi:sugar phosphate isomerase/epimerase